MDSKKAFLLWGMRITTILLLGIQATFCVRFFFLYARQGLPAALSYLKGDYIVLGNSGEKTLAVILKSPPHPYLSFGGIAFCFVAATIILWWLTRRLAQRFGSVRR